MDTGLFTGETVVFTGALTGPLSGCRRAAAKRLVISSGGRVAGSVTAATTLLVASRADTSKYRRAARLGVRVIGPADFAVMLGQEPLWPLDRPQRPMTSTA